MHFLCSCYIFFSFGLDNLPEGIRWAKQPYILDGRHLYTRLLVIHYHNKMGHFGREAVMNQHRQRCWIVGIRAMVKKTWVQCQHCKSQTKGHTIEFLNL
jgi:hypothetical protein